MSIKPGGFDFICISLKWLTIWKAFTVALDRVTQPTAFDDDGPDSDDTTALSLLELLLLCSRVDTIAIYVLYCKFVDVESKTVIEIRRSVRTERLHFDVGNDRNNVLLWIDTRVEFTIDGKPNDETTRGNNEAKNKWPKHESRTICMRKKPDEWTRTSERPSRRSSLIPKNQ